MINPYLCRPSCKAYGDATSHVADVLKRKVTFKYRAIGGGLSFYGNGSRMATVSFGFPGRTREEATQVVSSKERPKSGNMSKDESEVTRSGSRKHNPSDLLINPHMTMVQNHWDPILGGFGHQVLCTTHFTRDFSGWIGMFTGGTHLGFDPWPHGSQIKRHVDSSDTGSDLSTFAFWLTSIGFSGIFIHLLIKPHIFGALQPSFGVALS